MGRGKKKETIRGVINRKGKSRKIEVAARGVSNEGAPRSTASVNADGEQGYIKARDMKAVR